jgi:hypothetical protein
VNKRTSQLARSVLAAAPAGLALWRARGASRRRVAGALILAASGLGAIAAVRMIRQASAERGRFARESEIDDRIAESFPASDPPWQP